MKLVAILAVVATTAACGSASTAPDEEGDTSALVGGSEVDAPPTGMIGLKEPCGAVKIGPREFLTAGHCVVQRVGDVSVETSEPKKEYRRGWSTCFYSTIKI